MRFSNTSNDRAGSGRSTVIDKEYSDYRTLTEELELGLAGGHLSGGFATERDWFPEASGRNVHANGRWLVTLATSEAPAVTPDPDAPAAGWLIALEIDHYDHHTNRAIVLAGPWNLHTDKVLYAECPLANPDLDDLLSWLRERAI